MTLVGEIRCATIESFALGEGPRCDGPRERLLWADIPHGAVLAGRLERGSTHVTDRREVDGTVWLTAGDVIELGIVGLGSQRQNVIGPS